MVRIISDGWLLGDQVNYHQLVLGPPLLRHQILVITGEWLYFGLCDMSHERLCAVITATRKIKNRTAEIFRMAVGYPLCFPLHLERRACVESQRDEQLSHRRDSSVALRCVRQVVHEKRQQVLHQRLAQPKPTPERLILEFVQRIRPNQLGSRTADCPRTIQCRVSVQTMQNNLVVVIRRTRIGRKNVRHIFF